MEVDFHDQVVRTSVAFLFDIITSCPTAIDDHYYRNPFPSHVNESPVKTIRIAKDEQYNASMLHNDQVATPQRGNRTRNK